MLTPGVWLSKSFNRVASSHSLNLLEGVASWCTVCGVTSDNPVLSLSESCVREISLYHKVAVHLAGLWPSASLNWAPPCTPLVVLFGF